MNKIIRAKAKVMPLAMAIGISLMIIPYNSHKATPIVNMLYIRSDMPSVRFVFITSMAWGAKLADVKNAALYPIKSIVSMMKPDIYCGGR